eukprot:scaffold20689_cov41-Phaeocystis_antarctica.AAC.1
MSIRNELLPHYEAHCSTSVRTAYANLPSVCSVDHALWADPWCTMSPGPVRRAARRSEMQIMFAVREQSRSL